MTMSTDGIRKHIRAALDEVVSLEKSRLHDHYERNDSKIAQRIERMSPVIESLRALKEEIGSVNGIDIGLAQHGHMATVQINSSAQRLAYSISMDAHNNSFEIEERRSYSFGDFEVIEKLHTYESPDLVLSLIVSEVGKHIAQDQALTERQK